MKNIFQLVNIVKNVNLNSITLFTKTKVKKSKTHQLYHGIISGKFTSDEEASQYFYNSAPSHTSYKNLKSNLRTKLINGIFFLEPQQEGTDREKAFLYCIKNLAAAKIIFFNRAGLSTFRSDR